MNYWYFGIKESKTVGKKWNDLKNDIPCYDPGYKQMVTRLSGAME